MKNVRKPKQSRSINTVESIIDAGFIAVSRYGLDHTTVLKVCDLAGVGSGTFYEYFKNKDALFIEMHRHFVAEATHLIHEIIPDVVQLKIPEGIRLIFVRLGEMLIRDQNKYFYWLSVCGKFNTEESQVRAVKAINTLAIEYAVKHPEVLKIRDLRLMVYILINASLALTMSYFSDKNKSFQFEELVECLIRLTMSYIDDPRNQLHIS